MAAKKAARKRKPAPSPEAFLARHPPETQRLAQAARDLVRQAVPEAIEAVYLGWNLIGYRRPVPGGSAYFAFVAPQAEAVMLGFEHGVLLDDPQGVLQGGGRQVRQAPLRHPADADPKRLLPLIRQAAEVAALSKDEKARRMLAP
jgi:hypothetical protein